MVTKFMAIEKTKTRIEIEREFSAHHILLETAEKALKKAKDRQKIGVVHDQLIAMTFSALALEALANAFGRRLVPKWSHFEMAPPIAKLRTVARQLEIDDREFEQEPRAAAVWLMSFRNKVAHAARKSSLKQDYVE